MVLYKKLLEPLPNPPRQNIQLFYKMHYLTAELGNVPLQRRKTIQLAGIYK